MLTFSCIHFDNLSAAELYRIMVLRQEVFVVEQNCPYLDADGLDLQAWHYCGYDQQQRLLAYTRLLPEGVSYPGYCSIGRVVTHASTRREGYGKLLMANSIRQCRVLFGNTPIKIGAQAYLLRFYEGLGFLSTGEEYLEDGIPHIKMTRSAFQP